VAGLSDDQFFYLLCLAIAAGLFVLAANILGDRTGRAWRAVREDPLAAAAMTIPVNRVKAFEEGLLGLMRGKHPGILDAIRQLMVPPEPTKKRRIGFVQDD